jgi:hypothetical protein
MSYFVYYYSDTLGYFKFGDSKTENWSAQIQAYKTRAPQIKESTFIILKAHGKAELNKWNYGTRIRKGLENIGYLQFGENREWFQAKADILETLVSIVRKYGMEYTSYGSSGAKGGNGRGFLTLSEFASLEKEILAVSPVPRQPRPERDLELDDVFAKLENLLKNHETRITQLTNENEDMKVLITLLKMKMKI